MRRGLVAGNWKMYTVPAESRKLAAAVKSSLGDCDWADLVVCPPFTSITAVAAELRGSAIEIGAQDLHWEKEGAYTGEIAPDMLVAAGCRRVIIGHSERRHIFGETDEIVARKVKSALGAGLKPIVCLGETIRQRDRGVTKDIVKKQLLEGIGNLDHLSMMTIAYEPVWAIGTGRTATPAQAQDVHRYIRNVASEKWGADEASALRILYGGSVKPENAAELWREPDIDGFLVGGASLKADSFAAITQAVK